jgi:sialidase-1
MSDGRIGSCGDIPTPLDLVIKRSFDHGATWGPLQVVTDYGSNPSDVDTYPFYGLTNISRVSSGDAALLLDRSNGRIWTLYDNGGVSGSRKIKLEMKYSDDDGATWSPRIDVEAQNPGIRTSTSEFLTGPGNGIQLSQGPFAGRLIFPVYAYNNPSASMVIYSDNHGAIWQRSANAITNGGEVQVAELPGGELLASCRDNGFSWSGVRTFSRSTDGGVTWGAPYTNTTNPPTMADPACQGNIYRLTTTNDSNASRLIHANAANASSRVNMTLRISYDEGQTWPVSNQVYAAGSAYSSVTKLANGDIGLIFEKDPYGNLDYARRSVAEISGGLDSLPAYDVWAGQHFTPAQLMNAAISGTNANPDGDGFSNFQEFTAGTDPLDASSYLQLKILSPPVGTNVLLLQFNAVSNKNYTSQFSTNLATGGWQRFLDVSAQPTNSIKQLPVNPTNAAQFFRLVTPQLP